MNRFLMVFFVLLSACSSSNYNYEKLTTDSTILAFGDSLTYGYGASTSYPEYLEELINIKVINQGVNGDTTEGGLNRIVEVLDEYNPDLIILGLGGNDFLRKKSQAAVEDNLSKIIEIAKNRNIAVILMPEPQPSLLNIVSQSSSLGLSDSEIYQRLSEKHNILNMSGVISDLLSLEENKSDLIHLNDKGYKLLAEEISEHLKQQKIID